MKQKSKVYTFSAKDDDQIWVEGLKARLEEEDCVWSKAVLDSLKLKFQTNGKSKKLVQLETYCRTHDINIEVALEAVVIGHKMAVESAHRPLSMPGLN